MAQGKIGYINGLPSTQAWNVDEDQVTQAFRNSATKLGTGRVRGARSWSGGFTAHGQTPAILPREAFSFIGFTDPDSGISGDGTQYVGDAICTGVTVDWDFAGGVPVMYNGTFVGDLALTQSTGTSADATDPAIFPMCPCKFEMGVSASETEIPDVTSGTLALTCNVQSKVNSSTIINGVCWTAQEAGSIDWTLSISVENHTRGVTLPAIGTQERFKLWTSATEFWLLEYGEVKGYSGLTIDNDSNAILAATINIEMSGFKESDNSIGQIVLPSTDVYWPFA